MPKIAPNTPRSRTWNQAALTLTMDTAPKLWKYMFSAYSAVSTRTKCWARNSKPGPLWSKEREASPMRRLASIVPAPPSRIERRPPKRSVRGPLSTKEKP